MSSHQTVTVVSRTHSLAWPLWPYSIARSTMTRNGRKYGKQKTPILNGRTGARMIFSEPTPGQLAQIEKAKKHTILF